MFLNTKGADEVDTDCWKSSDGVGGFVKKGGSVDGLLGDFVKNVGDAVRAGGMAVSNLFKGRFNIRPEADHLGRNRCKPWAKCYTRCYY